ncbi:MAG: Na+/H+ antiporter NhaC family protein [Bacteroidales bacterium]|nr:Na+/H+ antiporter NhaC family protein [Bacteroidales bacterium]
MTSSSKKNNGWLAVSPLFVFLAIYLISSVLAKDFYKVPVTAAFLVSSVYALLITRSPGNGKSRFDMDGRLSIFSSAAGDSNVMLMIWIFVLAGAFAATAKDIGAIDATVEFTLKLMPARFLYAGLFVAACFISMAIGTSVGTVVALVPVASALAAQIGTSVPLLTAVVVGGAFFGDNLSFISDTTVAATRSLGVPMREKFRKNIKIAAPAAVLATIVYVVIGAGVSAPVQDGAVEWVKMLPYLLVIGMALAGLNVIAVLAMGLLANGIIGFAYGCFDWVGWLTSAGAGIAGMGELIIVTLLAGGMLGIIRYNGGMDFIINGLTRHIKGQRGASLSIAALVSLINFCTANNTIAIITAGPLAKDITERYRLDPGRSASILDVFSCLVQCIIPYGAQMLMASGLAGVSAISIMGYLVYPYALGVFALMSVLLTGRKT